MGDFNTSRIERIFYDNMEKMEGRSYEKYKGGEEIWKRKR